MTDRELLESAAKAAGLTLEQCSCKVEFKTAHIRDYPTHWNPLTDDGDALRLAVKCGITVDMHLERVRAYADELPRTAEEFFGADPYAAARRAIVRAAAEIGKQNA
jgi:hypothetical protein